MPKKKDCVDCIHCKSLNEKRVDCGYDGQAHLIDENHCAASDWGEFSSAKIKHLAETINKVENTIGNMKLGQYYRGELINLRREKKLRSQ